MRFLEDLDKMEKKRQEESERELLIRAAKSRYLLTLIKRLGRNGEGRKKEFSVIFLHNNSEF